MSGRSMMEYSGMRLPLGSAKLLTLSRTHGESTTTRSPRCCHARMPTTFSLNVSLPKVGRVLRDGAAVVPSTVGEHSASPQPSRRLLGCQRPARRRPPRAYGHLASPTCTPSRRHERRSRPARHPFGLTDWQTLLDILDHQILVMPARGGGRRAGPPQQPRWVGVCPRRAVEREASPG